MAMVWRILLVISLALLGLAVGTFVGGRFISIEGQGLEAAPIALGYGLISAIVLAIIALIAGFKLPIIRVKSLALFGFAGVILLYGILFYRMSTTSMETREPDSAFTNIGDFTAVMERLDLSDPGLFVKMEINSQTRKWVQTGPAPTHQVCSATMKSKQLADLRHALDNLASIDSNVLAACQATQGPFTKRMHWKVEGRSGTLNVSTICVQNHYPIARVLTLIESASRMTTSKVKCK